MRKELARIIKGERVKRDPGYDRGSEFVPPREAVPEKTDPLGASLAELVRRR